MSIFVEGFGTTPALFTYLLRQRLPVLLTYITLLVCVLSGFVTGLPAFL